MKKIVSMSIVSFILVGCSSVSINSDGSYSAEDLISRTVSSKGGKVGAAIDLDYTLPKTLSPSQTLDISITLNVNSSAYSLKVSQSTDSSVILLSPALFNSSLTDGEMNFKAQVLLPPSDGLYYLYLSAQELNSNGKSMQARSFAIPLQIGSGKPIMKTNGKLVNNGEEKIVEMIAEER